MTTPIDETLTHLAVEAWHKMETSEQSLHELGLIAEAKLQLYKAIMEVIGEDEKFKNVYQWQQAEPLNLLRQEIRANIKTLFGIEE